MLSVVIADDEADIIELCKTLITYPEAAVTGEAHNGVELLDVIGRLQPDVVITDICMPGMTGLELIEKAKQLYPAVNFVVMSGYTDFQYVQSALRFGVWDYLLKPLKRTEVNRVLEKLHKHLGEQTARERQSVRMQDDLRESRDKLREQYVRDLWESGRASCLRHFEEGDGFALPDAVVQCVAFSIDSNFPVSSAEAPALARQATGTIDKIRELLPAACRTSGFFANWPYAAMLLIYPETAAAPQSEALLREIGREIRAQNSRNNLIHLAAAASALLPGQEEAAGQAVRQAKAALKWRLEKKQSDVLLYSAQAEERLRETAAAFPGRWEKELQAAVEQLDAEAAAGIVRRTWKSWGCGRQMPGARYHLLERMLHCLNTAAERLPGANGEPAKPLRAFDILSGGYGEEELAQRLAAWAAQAIGECRERIQSRENSVVLQAKEYVALHYAEGISLNDVAKHVCLSASYFSTLFKSETGSGFVEYVQHVRIEQAKRLLRESKMRVADIAHRVGYHDMKFFNKIFYKETNVMPSEYRKFYT